MSAPAQPMRSPSRATLAIFLGLNLALKLALLPVNRAEYTDGILQLTVFENRAGLYPPLYGLLARMVSWTGLGLEWSGRTVSALAGALAVVPVYGMARRLGGEGAARFAALFFTISPLVLRWSERVMTDSLFLLLTAFCLLFAHEAWLAVRPEEDGARDAPAEGEALPEEARERGADPAGRGDRLLALAMASAALAALTRYQGVFLLLPLALAAGTYFRACRRMPWRTAGAALLWIGLPLWMLYGGFAHGGQFAERAAAAPLALAFAWVNTAEAFVLIAPYYFGYPVAALAAAGLFALLRSPRRGPAVSWLWLWLWGVWGAALLAVQAVFGSFQYRYMLPLLPALLVLGGVGAARLEEAARSRWQRLVFSAGLLLSIVYLTLSSCAVLLLQRGTFGDQRAAADWIAANVPAEVPVYSNERYGNFRKLGSVKLSFWTGRPVRLLGAPERGATPFDLPKPQVLPPGAVVVLSNAYGGNEQLAANFAELSARYRLRPLTEEPFTAEIIPLHDDVMVDPLYNQNPLGWVLRYVPQRFQTRIFLVDGPRDEVPGGAAPSGNGTTGKAGRP